MKSAERELVIAARIVRFASIAEKIAFEFPTKDSLKKYLNEHPKADKTLHKVVETKKEPEKKVWKHHIVLDRKRLEDTLSKGHFSIISAGKNPNDPIEKQMDADDEVFHKRHELLKDALEKQGIEFTEVAGCYAHNKEPSFMVFHDPTELTRKTLKSVMVHHADAKALAERKKEVDKLGVAFNQDSVLHGEGGKNTLDFTAGANKGKTCSGKGWKEIEKPRPDQFYTDIDLKDRKHTKFDLDLAECKKKGLI